MASGNDFAVMGQTGQTWPQWPQTPSVPASKHQLASDAWAAAKTELTAATEDGSRVEARLQAAVQAERAAWSQLEEAAGRNTQKACAPDTYRK